MKKGFYKETKHYTIYALLSKVEDDYLYVGKTTNARVSAVYSWHICGHCAATDCYFSKEERPDLHILDEGNMTGAQAYQTVVAWVNVFQKAGYVLINHEGTLAHAELPNEETRLIIQSIISEPLDDVLKRTYVARPVEADRKNRSLPMQIMKMKQYK